jgi:antirestriction protein ArdC
VSFKQAKGKGGRVKKGEKGFPVVFWKWVHVKDPESESGKKRVPFLRYYTVFNLEQTEGIDIPEPQTRDFNPIMKAERVIHGMPNAPVIEHNEPRAYYQPSEDVVNMPKANLFQTDEEYYSTLFHELTHSTGHASRLNRDEISKMSPFDSQDYSKEELVAEIGSAFLCGHCGIEPSVIENQAAYIQSWLKQLRSNKKWLVYAAAKAQKAADYILGVKHEEENSLPGGHPTGNDGHATPNR